VRWDFFLAHAGADSPTAERLRSLLEPHATVFEDSMLQPGEDWAVALDQHLRASLITVVMISRHMASAYYLREEVARAIELDRADSGRRVVPLLLEQVDNGQLPYGLAMRSPVVLSENLDLPGAAHKLLASLRDLRGPRHEGPREAAVQLEAALDQLDRDALEGGRSDLLRAAVDDVGGSEALWLHLRRRGLDPRVVLPSLHGHDKATARWMIGASEVPGARDLPEAVRQRLVASLDDERTDVTALRREVLLDHATSSAAHHLATQLVAALLPVRSMSTEAVLVSTASSPPAPLPPLHRSALGMMALPRREPTMRGRDTLVADLAGRILTCLERQDSATAFITGQLGAGVSAVAIETARTLADQFPGGVRYVDLQGMNEDARKSEVDVARLVCHSLGAPASPGAELTDYRATMTGSGVLLVLDNALGSKQIAGLVPAPTTCAIIVTSRNRTQGYADAGLVVHVQPLDRTSSVDVLASARPDASAEALDRIAQACADLPMALQLISSWMTNHPEMGAEGVAAQMASEKARLGYLDDDVLPMRLAIELSYRHLDDDAQRAFRFLPAAPGSTCTAEDFGRGLELHPDLTRLTLYRLVDRSVAGCSEVAEHEPMFRLFELVRLYALERLEKEESPDVVARFRRLMTQRLLDQLDTVDLDPVLRLDHRRLVSARDLAEREEWLDLAAELTDRLQAVAETDDDKDAARRERRHAADLRARNGDAEDAARAYLEMARELDDEAAEKMLADAEGIATAADLVGLAGEIAFELALRREKRDDLAGALEAGKRSVNALTAVGLRATAAPVANNNTRLALRIDDMATAKHWAAVSRSLLDAKAPLWLRSAVAWEDARVAEEPDKVRAWREALRLERETERWDNAGLAAFNGARIALHNSSTAEAAELFLAAADLLRKAGDLGREVWALIGLSTAYASIDQHAQALDLLSGLRDRVASGNCWHPDVAAELDVRVAILAYLTDGSQPAQKHLLALRNHTSNDLSRLSEISDALQHPEHAEDRLRGFAESPMVYAPPDHKPWLHHSLGKELPNQLSLE